MHHKRRLNSVLGFHSPFSLYSFSMFFLYWGNLCVPSSALLWYCLKNITYTFSSWINCYGFSFKNICCRYNTFERRHNNGVEQWKEVFLYLHLSHTGTVYIDLYDISNIETLHFKWFNTLFNLYVFALLVLVLSTIFRTSLLHSRHRPPRATAYNSSRHTPHWHVQVIRKKKNLCIFEAKAFIIIFLAYR